MVDEHALAALAGPGFQFDGAQIRHVLRADDVEPFLAHEAQIGRILLGLEFVRQVLRDDRVLGHGRSPRVSSWCSSGGGPAAMPVARGLDRRHGPLAPVAGTMNGPAAPGGPSPFLSCPPPRPSMPP